MIKNLHVNRSLALAALAIFMILPGLGWGQTSTQNFGTSTGSHTSQTGSTTFIPNPTPSSSGTTYARAGATTSASINLVTASNPLGTTGSYVRAVASTTTSCTKMSPIVGYTNGTSFYTKMTVLFGTSTGTGTATSGTWQFVQGAGANYSDNQLIQTAQVFTGLRFTFGTSSALTLEYFNNLAAWVTTNLTSTALTQATVYTIEIVGNNASSGSISYTYNGTSKSLTFGTFDLYINGVQYGNGLAKGALPAGNNINAMMYIGISSTLNVANLFVDDVVVYNSVPSTIGGTPATLTTSAVSSIQAAQATGNGEITAAGSTSITASGVCWNTSTSPTIANSKTTDGPTSTGVFTSVMTGLSVNTKYYVKAYATNSSGTAYGNEVNYWTLANTPSTPTVANATTTSLNVSINANSNPNTTEFAIQETGGQYIQSDGSLGASAVWQTATSWGTKTVTGLSSNTQYTFQVKARNGINVETGFGSTASGTTIVAKPTALAANTVSSTGFTANWDPLAGVSSYRLDVSTLSNFGLTTKLSENFIGVLNCSIGSPCTPDISTSLDTYLQTTGWTGSKNYEAGGAIKLGTTSALGYIITKTVDLSGGSGNALLNFDLQLYGTDVNNLIQVFHAADGVTFNQVGSDITATGSMVTQTVAITGGTSNSKIKISAKLAANNRFYLDNIIISQDDPNSLISGYENLLVNATSQPVIGLTPNTTYYYRLRAIGSASTSANSNVTTVLTAPAAPIATAATDIASTGFTANWNITTGATGYRLDVATDNGFTSLVTGYTNLDVTNVITFGVTGLDPSTPYYYRVRAYNGDGSISDNSNTITLTTLTPAITVSTPTLSGFTYAFGSGPSAEQSFTVSGANLIGNLTLTPPADYEISTVSGVSFAPTNPITLTPVTGTVASTTIYVRLKAGLSAGTFNSENIAAASTGATEQNVACSGTVTPSIWSHMITNGTPIVLHYLGDKLASGTWIQFEIGQDPWDKSEAGIGQSNTDPSAWDWRGAFWYEDGTGSNKKVQTNFSDFQFKSIGNWYINGRVKVNSVDPFNYANSTTWQNTTSFAPAYYFAVDPLTNPTAQSATAVSSSKIDLSWAQDATPHFVMVVRKKSTDTWTEPTQGTAYAVNEAIGAGVVVFNGGGTSYSNTGLEANTAYDYKFYSENYSYYSAGITANATTLPTEYAVTGGGSYCQGSGGLPVGIANSETGVTYTLTPGGATRPGLTGSPVSFGNQLAGTYTVSGSNAGGSTDMAGEAVITETPSSTVEATASACDTYTWAVNGATYTASGNYNFVVGCVTNILHLTITPSSTVEATASACDTYTWALNGVTYTASGNYTYVAGCVTNILRLTITPSSTVEVTESACDTYTWALNSVTYTASGNYNFVVGCVTNILHLTITPSSTVEATESACDSYTWTLNDVTYNASGDYTYVVGCVTNILHLTITPPTVTPAFTQLGPYCKGATPGNLLLTSSNGIAGTWNPATVSTANAGIATYTFTPTAGQCAATTTMDIVVNDPPTADAGPDGASSTNQTYLLSGASATNYTSYSWSTDGNIASFSGTGTLAPSYATGTTSAVVTFTLTAIGNAGCGSAISAPRILYITDPQTPLTWKGQYSDVWGDYSNWSPVGVPGDITNVTIPVVASNYFYPTVYSAAVCNNITVKAGASLKDQGLLTLSANAIITVEHPLVEKGRWHFISSPVADQKSNLFNNHYLRSFTPAGGYVPILNSTTPLTPMEGFALWPDGADFTAPYYGKLNKELSYTFTISGAGTVGGLNERWNLVGNPYPSSIDWTLIAKDDVEGAVYVRNGSSWSSYTSGVGVPGTFGPEIAPTQGFFVRAKTSAGGSLTFTNDIRVHHNTTLYKNADAAVPNLVRLKVSGNGFADEAVVRFLPEATTEFDSEFDAVKLYGDVAAAAQLYTLGSQPLAINALPQIDDVSVGIKTGTNGTYTIAATELNNLSYVTLEDTQTGIFTDLSANPYTFEAVAGTFDQRFKLHFSFLSVDEAKKVSVVVYSYQQTVHINLKDQVKSDIYIYNISGQLVATKLAAQGMNEIKLPNAGNYIVKVISKNNSEVRKVFIQK